MKSQGALPRVGIKDFSLVLVFSLPLFLCPGKGEVPLLSQTTCKNLLGQSSLGSCSASASLSPEEHLEGSPCSKMRDCMLHNVFFFPERDYGVFSLAHVVSALSSSFPSI